VKTIREITSTTKLCAVIGDPVSHSLSPAIHNRAFQETGLDFVYMAFRVKDLRPAVDGMRALENFRGLSVTIPHKVSIVDLVDEVGEVDRRIGSINTVVNDRGKLIGLGTDGPGARKALLDAGVDAAGRTVMILGTGGAARAIAFNMACNAAPSSLIVLGVDKDELAGLLRDLKEKTALNVSGDVLDDSSLKRGIGNVELVIQATPVGMHPRAGESLIPRESMHRDLAVMDIVYNPFETKLIRDAREKGLNAVPGYKMFINQAALQFEAWTGKRAPMKAMEDEALKRLAARQP
jgi:shikimate dehydrogenase